MFSYLPAGQSTFDTDHWGEAGDLSGKSGVVGGVYNGFDIFIGVGCFFGDSFH